MRSCINTAPDRVILKLKVFKQCFHQYSRKKILRKKNGFLRRNDLRLHRRRDQIPRNVRNCNDISCLPSRFPLCSQVLSDLRGASCRTKYSFVTLVDRSAKRHYLITFTRTRFVSRSLLHKIRVDIVCSFYSASAEMSLHDSCHEGKILSYTGAFIILYSKTRSISSDLFSWHFALLSRDTIIRFRAKPIVLLRRRIS